MSTTSTFCSDTARYSSSGSTPSVISRANTASQLLGLGSRVARSRRTLQDGRKRERERERWDGRKRERGRGEREWEEEGEGERGEGMGGIGRGGEGMGGGGVHERLSG
mgnify:CR=1 FL=1